MRAIHRNSGIISCAVMSVLLAAFASCRLEVPIREMTQAKSAITRAVEVKAERYAPDELKASRELLVKSHEEAMKDKMDGAKENAAKSNAKAEEAINKSLPLLSRDSLDETKKIYGEADMLFASRFAAEPFTGAGKAIEEAETLHNNRSYWDSYLKSQEALRLATEAKDKSNGEIPALKSEIARLGGEADKLAGQRGTEFAAADIKDIKDRLKSADSKIEQNNLKEAWPLVEEAKQKLGGAEQKTMRGMADEKLTRARASLQEAQASPVRQQHETEINSAATLITASNELFARNSYRESIAKSDEAIGVLGGLKTAMGKEETDLKGMAKNKLENAETGLGKLNTSEQKDQFQQDIGKITELVGKGRTRFEAKSYHESVAASDEAISMINSVSIAMEKKREESTMKVGEGAAPAEKKIGDEILQVYEVKYNRQHRDCLWRIAQYTYRDARLWPLIYVANKDLIRDPDLIFPGQKLKIPVIPQARAEQKIEPEKKEAKGAEKKDSSAAPAQSAAKAEAPKQEPPK